MKYNQTKDHDRSIFDLIGHTPLIRLEKLGGEDWCLLAKCEFLNPTGSLKDRMVYYMIRAAEIRGELKPGSRIVEATSGNTGISLSMIGARLGYRVTAVMPENMSVERRQMIEMYGAEIILTPADKLMEGSVSRVEDIARKDPYVWVPRQFSNFDNVECHRMTTGPEIIKEAGAVDAFIAGVGTGGTLMGVGRLLKRNSKKTRIVAVEPSESPVLSGGRPGFHSIQGIGSGFIPELVDLDMIDVIITVSSEEAIVMKERLAREEGLFVGISSGANVVAAHKIASELGNGCRIVVMLVDSGDRYLSFKGGENET